MHSCLTTAADQAWFKWIGRDEGNPIEPLFLTFTGLKPPILQE